MKKIVQEFIRRGLMACGFGPLVLVVLYLVLKQTTDVQVLSVREVCLGIVSLSALAFIAGGMNVLYQIERLPLMAAILLHGGVLYGGYLAVYLVNGWLQSGVGPLLIFTLIFAVGYLVIWCIIYFATRRRTARLNQILQQKRSEREE